MRKSRLLAFEAGLCELSPVLQEAADRVLELAPRHDGTPFAVDREAQIEGARAALIVTGQLPHLDGAVVVSVGIPANIAVGDVPWGLCPDLVVQPGDELPTGRPLIVQVRDAHRRADVLELLDRAAAGPAVVVEWGWPGRYSGPLPRICTRGYSQPGAAAVTELLRKAGWDK